MYLEMPAEYEERTALMEYIVNAVIDETMSARQKHGLTATNDWNMVRAIVEKTVRELEGT